MNKLITMAALFFSIIAGASTPKTVVSCKKKLGPESSQFRIVQVGDKHFGLYGRKVADQNPRFVRFYCAAGTVSDTNPSVRVDYRCGEIVKPGQNSGGTVLKAIVRSGGFVGLPQVKIISQVPGAEPHLMISMICRFH